jgi:predicted nuclease with TOPRIM domain
VRAEELHRLVWDEVTKLLRNPEEILRYFHEQHGKEVGTTFDLARRKLSELERSLAVLKREECRLVDAYQGQVIELEELRERRSAIDQRRKELRADVKRVEQELGKLQRYGSIREGVALLTKKLAGSLEELTFEEKQKIIQLLVEEIRVHAGHVEIHYIMPLSGNLHLQSRSLPLVPFEEA